MFVARMIWSRTAVSVETTTLTSNPFSADAREPELKCLNALVKLCVTTNRITCAAIAGLSLPGAEGALSGRVLTDSRSAAGRCQHALSKMEVD